MSSDIKSPEPCQVDFYVLGETSPEAISVACQLSLMAWERKQRVFVVTVDDKAAQQLDEHMWQHPQGRFLPHTRAGDPDSTRAPVNIGPLSTLNPTDVVINLCPEAVPQPERFNRILEIVPHANEQRNASRVKYKTYRNLGITPRTQEINKRQ